MGGERWGEVGRGDPDPDPDPNPDTNPNPNPNLNPILTRWPHRRVPPIGASQAGTWWGTPIRKRMPTWWRWPSGCRQLPIDPLASSQFYPLAYPLASPRTHPLNYSRTYPYTYPHNYARTYSRS